MRMHHLRVCALLPVLLAGVGLTLGACFSTNNLDGSSVPHGNYVADWRDEMIYQVLTDRFADGDPSNDYGVRLNSPARYHGGDWKGIEDHLDYIQALGVTTLWISPIVKNVDSDANIDGYHGYWTQDFTALNPHFGDLGALRSMVAAAHARGLKVILDIVTNHVGQAFFYDINGDGVPDEAVWGGGQPGSAIQHITEYDPDYQEPVVMAFTSLGQAGPAPVIFVQDPTTNHMPPRCDGCPFPDLFQTAEAYHRRGRVFNWGNDECCYDASTTGTIPDWCKCSSYGQGTTAPSWCMADVNDPVCHQVPFGDFPGGLKDVATENPHVRDNMFYAYARWMTLVDFDGFRIDTLKHVEHGFWKDFCPRIRDHAAKDLGKQRFLMFGEAFTGFDPLIGSYTADGEVDSAFYFSQKFVIDSVFKNGGATSQLRDLFGQRATHYNNNAQPGGAGQPASKLLVNFLDNHDVARFLYDKPDLKALHSALFFLYTEDGIPCLYYGTEQEFSGGNDPANREDLWNSGYGTSGETFQFIRKLTELRKRLEPLRRGDLSFVMTTSSGPGILAFERFTADRRVLVVVNTSDTDSQQTVDGATGMTVGFAAGTVLVNALNPTETITVGSEQPDASQPAVATVRATVAPREGKIYVPQGQL